MRVCIVLGLVTVEGLVALSKTIPVTVPPKKIPAHSSPMIPSAWRPPLITPSPSHRRNGHVALAPFESAAGASRQVAIAVRVSQEVPTEILRTDFRSENAVGLLDEEVEEAAKDIMICDMRC